MITSYYTNYMQGRIQDLKKGGAKCTGASRPGKFRCATPTFDHASALVGVVKRNFAIARAQTISFIDGRLRLESKWPAVQC